MLAVQIRTFGDPESVLELADLPEPPAPAAGEVLIGVEHAHQVYSSGKLAFSRNISEARP